MRRNERLLVESVDLNNYIEVSNLRILHENKGLLLTPMYSYLFIVTGLKLVEDE